MDGGVDTAWLSTSEAARRLGLTRDAVHKRLRRGTLEGRRGNDGSIRVRVATTPPVHDAATPALGHGVDTVPLVAELRERLDRTLAELAGLRERAAHAEGELVAEVRRSIEHQAAMADLRAILAREQARGDRLATELAMARRGWLERMIDALWQR
jgi:hypothetical protein